VYPPAITQTSWLHTYLTETTSKVAAISKSPTHSSLLSTYSFTYICLTILSVAQTIQHQNAGLVNNKFDGMWKEVVVAWFNVLAQHLP
jgi:hypothetical protein